MNFRKGKGREEPEINLIPFIDVLLVILIFLMVTTTYSRFTELQITLPTADAEKAQDTKPNQINIGIDAQGRYKINDQAVSFLDTATLADDLKKQPQLWMAESPVLSQIRLLLSTQTAQLRISRSLMSWKRRALQVWRKSPLLHRLQVLNKAS